MKRIGNLYPYICDEETLLKAIKKASKGKRKRRNVQKILANKELYAHKLHVLLTTETFVPNDYKSEVKIEGTNRKKRDISKPNFYPDQIIHWAVYLAIRDWMHNSMYAHSCGSIPKRGPHYGKKYIEKWIRNDHKGTKYYFKMDVKKFYPSIPVDKLIEKLNRKIKDKRLMKLIVLILSKSDGLPIGMLLSQVFGNLYLSDLDFYIKQECHAEHLSRFADDIVVFGRSKRKLHKTRDAINKWLEVNGLQMKENWQVCKLDKEPLDFMGFRFFRDHTILRKALMFRITRKVHKVHKKRRFATNGDASAVISYMGWIKCTDSYKMFVKRIKPYLHLGRLKAIVRRYQRENLQIQQHPATA